MKKRNKLSAMTAFAVVAALALPTVASATTVSFTDIGSSFASQAIQDLANQGILNGTGNGMFNPKGNITRQDMAIVLAKALKLDVSAPPSTPTFSDVPTSNYAFAYVEAAVKAGIIKGEGNGAFGYGQNLTREQMALMFANALGADVTGQASNLNFSDDNSISSYAKDAVGFAVKQGLISGYNGMFNPQGNATREQVAAVAEKFLGLKSQTMKLTASATNVAVGQKVTFSVTGTKDAVTYSVDNSGVIDASGNFVAAAAGTYNVTATVDGQTLKQAVTVYGSAVSYKVTSSASNLMADDATYNTITVTAVDANGNPALGYNGKAIVADSAPTSLIAAATTAGDQPTDFSNVAGVNYIQFTNGVATLAVGPTAAQNVSDTITVTDTDTSAPLTSATYTFSSAASTLSKLALAVASGSSSAISANGQYSTTLTLSAENAAGNVFAGQPGTYVTLSLTGPGSFQAGVTPVTTETVYVPTSGTLPVTVYSLPGQAGSISVSASATGLTGATLSVPSYINTAAGSISFTSTNGKDSAGNTYTLYTAQLLDTNGHPITTSTANDAFSVSDNSSSVNGVLQYGTVNTSTGVFTPTSTTGFTGNLVNGIATFAVETNTVGTGSVTLSLNDSTNSFTQTAPYTFAAGVATKLSVSPSSTVYNVKPGQTVKYTAQLQDANSNNVALVGQPVTFSFVGTPVSGVQFPTGQSTYTVNTDANGVATVSFTIPSNSTGGTLQLHAADGSLTPANSASVTVLNATNTAAYASQVVITDGANPLSTVTATAGGTISGTIDAIAENAIGSPVGTSDQFALSSNNTNVVSIPTVDATVTSAAGLKNIESDLTVGTVGSAVITVQDISNPDAPQATFTVNVTPGSAAGAVVEYNGAKISATNTVNVAANTAVQLQVVNADGSGDPLPVVGSAPVTVNLGTNGVTGDFRLTATGAPVTSVTLQPGQSSVPVYFISSTAETLNLGTQLTATEVAGTVSASNSTVTATSTATAGTGNVTVKVTAKDVNNVALGSGQTVTVTDNSATPVTKTATWNVANSDYEATFDETTAGTSTFTANVGGTAVTATASTTVNPAAAATLTVTGLVAGAHTTAQTVTVTAKDSYGNIAKGYVGTVHFTSTDASATLPADYTFVAADNGVHTFNNVSFSAAGSYTVTVTDAVTSTITGTTSSVTVS